MKSGGEVLCPLQKFGKRQNNLFLFIDLMRIAPDLFGHSLCKGSNFFSYNMEFLGIKRHKILCLIQKYKHSLVKITPT
jgi:hypothetical protein